MFTSYVEANARSRERLRAVVRGLSEQELALAVVDGWTIAALLAHMAFWDYRVLALIARWKENGVGRSPIDVDSVNDGMKPLCLAIPARAAVDLVLAAAEATDAELSKLPEVLKPGIQTLVREGRFRLDRSTHRHEHLEQIETVLAQCRQSGTARQSVVTPRVAEHLPRRAK